jgi:hypothetical protein
MRSDTSTIELILALLFLVALLFFKYRGDKSDKENKIEKNAMSTMFSNRFYWIAIVGVYFILIALIKRFW